MPLTGQVEDIVHVGLFRGLQIEQLVVRIGKHWTCVLRGGLGLGRSFGCGCTQRLRVCLSVLGFFRWELGVVLQPWKSRKGLKNRCYLAYVYTNIRLRKYTNTARTTEIGLILQ